MRLIVRRISMLSCLLSNDRPNLDLVRIAGGNFAVKIALLVSAG